VKILEDIKEIKAKIKEQSKKVDESWENYYAQTLHAERLAAELYDLEKKQYELDSAGISSGNRDNKVFN
tara:strand:+ start:9047 stop:9253 length:207 start_codon:yes stop_codon:yes gene_type:complete